MLVARVRVWNFELSRYSTNLWTLMTVFHSVTRGFQVKPQNKRSAPRLAAATWRRFVVVGCLLHEQMSGVTTFFKDLYVKAAAAPLVTLVWGWDETYQWVATSDPKVASLREFMKSCEATYGPQNESSKPGDAQRLHPRKKELRSCIVQTAELHVESVDAPLHETLFIPPMQTLDLD
jgi:hypothetical protein